ncbi:MAG: 5-formyltetrahydrofolate cyclo-ligase, partial [Proteobacteria bacterium]|nr:5-formyltetrahydrofolate cyclo-ligase [Pseudomonadota bacterium]
TRALIGWLQEAGHQVLLPVVVGKAAPLMFRVWRAGDPLVAGGFGTQVPSPGAKALIPEVLFVPLLAYDDDGYRLGYGGGFYDRTLEMLRGGGNPIAIGVAYAAQRVDSVPRTPHDQRLDWLATEAGVSPARPAAGQV